MNDATETLSMEGLTQESLTLHQDVVCVLLECHRERRGDGVFHPEASETALTELAALMARRLGPLIGGRYIPKRDERAARDAAVWRAFNGRNHRDVTREFGISRRLLYSILARKRRA